MGINLSAVVESAFTTVEGSLDNTVIEITYRHKDGTESFDPVTETYTGGSVDYPNIKVIVTKPKSNEYLANLISKGDPATTGFDDRYVLIPSARLAVDPQLADVVIIGSEEWQVTNVMGDPAAAHWKVRIKRPHK